MVLDTPTGVTPLDLSVTATPFSVDEDRFIMVAIEDVSHPKRLAVLQRIFFHDVLNTAGCLQGYAQYLLDEVSDSQDVLQCMTCLADQLVEAIQSQRDLVHAEAGELRTQPEPVRASRVLEELRLPIPEARCGRGAYHRSANWLGWNSCFRPATFATGPRQHAEERFRGYMPRKNSQHGLPGTRRGSGFRCP